MEKLFTPEHPITIRMKCFTCIVCFLYCAPLFSQLQPQSIHQEQSNYYSQFDFSDESQYDSLHGLKTAALPGSEQRVDLTRTVFGYHPYWMGTSYLEYRWDLISDLCYFSYEVDPYTGYPANMHNWLTAPVIDSAMTHGVNVHLCVTLFEAHTVFFSNPTSQQALIDTLISLVTLRNAQGINIDFEAVPSALSSGYNQFLIMLAGQFHEKLPGITISMAAPAVDWNESLDLFELQPVIDLFMIMGYDYYWNGSSQAGPVDGLYSMAPGYDYNLSRTVSWYLSKGIPREKILLGLPYYGRQWPVQNQYAPSGVTGWGTAVTYYQVRDNASGHYSDGNKHREQNSFSPYYSFQSNGWNHCFINDGRSLGKRFDLVNQRGLAGIGIWALGYDHGYSDFWQVIQDKLTTQSVVVFQDTLYDSGGPAFSYYPDEHFQATINHPGCEALHLTFFSFDLEPGTDILSVFDGSDTSFPLLGQFTGSDIPARVTATSGSMTLQFDSDQAVNHPGWMAIWHCGPLGIQDTDAAAPPTLVGWNPNPVSNYLEMDLLLDQGQTVKFETFDGSGKLAGLPVQIFLSGGSNHLIFYPGQMGINRTGIYLTRIIFSCGRSNTLKWIYSGE